MSKEVKWDALFKDRRTTGQVKPLLLQTNEKIFDGAELMTSEQLYEDSTVQYSTTQSTIHNFKYQTEICSDWVLEFVVGSGTWDVGHYAIYTLIEEVELIISSKSIIKYTGSQLFEYLWFWNVRNGADSRVLLKTLSDAGSGNISGQRIRTPLLLPGQNGIFGSSSQPINLNLLKDPFHLKITLKAGNRVSKTNALTISTIRLHRRSWKMEEQNAKLYNKFSMVDFNYKSISDTFTQSVQWSDKIDDVFDSQGVKEVIGLFVRLVSDTNVNTDFETFQGEAIDDLRLTNGSYDLYYHTSVFEGTYKLIDELAVTQRDTVSNGYQYFIPFSNSDLLRKFENKGNPGISLRRIHAGLKLTSSSIITGTHHLYLTSVNKCTFVIRDNGSAEMVY